MAIAPKNPRKRAAKKSPKVKGETNTEAVTESVASTPAIEAPSFDTASAEPAEKKVKPAKKAASVPVAIFQAAPVAEKAPAKKAPAKKSAPAKVVDADDSVSESDAKSDSATDSDSEDGSRGRRRRRGVGTDQPGNRHRNSGRADAGGRGAARWF